MVNVDLKKIVLDSAVEGLARNGLPDTPHNRLVTLSGMYSTIESQGFDDQTVKNIRQILEEEIVRLDDQEV